MRTVEILAELDGRVQLAGKLRVAVDIAVRDGLLEPIEPLVVQPVAARERIAEGVERWKATPVGTLCLGAGQPEALQLMAELVL